MLIVCPYVDCVKEIDAQRVLGYALFKDGKHTKLSYPLEAFDSDVSGRSFHNGRFVQRMRDKAATLSKYYTIFVFYLFLNSILFILMICLWFQCTIGARNSYVSS